MRTRSRLARAAAIAAAAVAMATAWRQTTRADVVATPAWRVANGVTTAALIDDLVYVGGTFTQLHTPSTRAEQFYDPVTGQVRDDCARSTDTEIALAGWPDGQGGLLVVLQNIDALADAGGPFQPPPGTTIGRIADTCLWDRQFAAPVIDATDPFNTTVGIPARVGGNVVAAHNVADPNTSFLRPQVARYSGSTGARVGFRNDYTGIGEIGVLGASTTRIIVRYRSTQLGEFRLGALDPVTLDLTQSSSTLADEAQGVRSWVRGTTLYRLRPAPVSRLEAYDLTNLQAKTGWTAPVVPSLADLEVSGNRVFLTARVINGQTVPVPSAVVATSGAVDSSWTPPALTRRLPDPNGQPYVPVLTALGTLGSRVYFSGDFERVGGVDREGVAALSTQTAALDSWDAAPWLVSPIESTTTALLMTRPTGANRETRRYLAAIDRATGVSTTWDPNAPTQGLLHTPSPVATVAVDATHVYFASATTGELLRALRTTAAVDQNWRVVTTRADGTPGVVTTMTVANDLVYLGGDFARVSGTSFGATDRRWLAAVGVDGRLSPWAPQLDGPEGATWLRTLMAEGSTIYLGGDFTAVSGTFLLGFGAVDGQSGTVTQPLMFVPGENTTIHGLASDGTQTFVAGVAFNAPLVGAASIPDSQLTQYGPTNGVVPTSAAFVAGRLYAGLEYDPEAAAPTGRTTRWGKVVADARALVHMLEDGTVEYYPAIPGNPPGAPTLTASSAGNTVTVAWTPAASGGPPTSYILYAGSAPGLTNLATIPVRGATSFSANAPTGRYYLSVVARNGYGTSPPSNEVSVQAGCVSAPLAPTALAYTKFADSVRLSWTGAETALAYRLEAGTSPGTSGLGVVPLGNVTSLSATAPLGTYYVRLRAVNACGTSPASNEIVVNLDGARPLPASPTAFTASVVGRTVAFQWTPASTGGSASSFRLDAGTSPGSTIAQFPVAGTSVVVPNAPTGTFYVRLRALNAAGASAPTPDITVVVP